MCFFKILILGKNKKLILSILEKIIEVLGLIIYNEVLKYFEL